ncbi:Protein of unknown function, DUF255 [Lishizhenia tianjinensis]|uniref:Spermatogenesis-associated protein 20-like TRX domain-containing protein n=1 Tax=Lishizhenia tianjinensis TaxID=477690 RepID=A0A1I6XI67_9FLAO|nr:DUF255 domain-containing protein [Lishizhenia tianjinensis]SFT38010.1 Protein of unknown function, DUF255 [Lishizhenia tianjinensis]
MRGFTYTILGLGLLLFSCANLKDKKEAEITETTHKVTTINDSTVHWYGMEEGISLAQKQNKLIFVDVYTDWCGWCKKMDASTFKDKEVIKALNQDYIAVKFDGEEKDTVNFFGTDYKFVNNGRRGYHELAAVLLDGRLSYPSFVVLNNNGNREKKLIGFMNPEQFLTQLK